MAKPKPYRITSIILPDQDDDTITALVAELPDVSHHAIMRSALRLGLERLCEASYDAKVRLVAVSGPATKTRKLTASNTKRRNGVKNASTPAP